MSWILVLVVLFSIVLNVCAQSGNSCNLLQFCNKKGTCRLNRKVQVCECQEGYKGATCSIAPPELASGLMIPGGIAMTDTAYYLVKEPLTEGYRIRMSVSQGLVNVKGSVGRVPSKNQFQLVGVPNDDLGKEVTLTIATTIPCTECGMTDFNLYLLVENNGNGPAEFTIWLEESYEPLIPGMSFAASVVLVLFFVCLLASCLALVVYIVVIKIKRSMPEISSRREGEKEKERQRQALKRNARTETTAAFDSNEIALENITKYDEAALTSKASVYGAGGPRQSEAAFMTAMGGGVGVGADAGVAQYDESSFSRAGGATSEYGGGIGHGGSVSSLSHGGSVSGMLYSANVPLTSAQSGAYVCSVCGNSYALQEDLQTHCQKRGHPMGGAYGQGYAAGDRNMESAYGEYDNGDQMKSLF